MNSIELLNALKTILHNAVYIIDKISNQYKLPNENTIINNVSDDSNNDKYYCYAYYSALYDYGGNCDNRDTMFPVLQEIFTDAEKANAWLQTMIGEKSIRTEAYCPIPYNYEILRSIYKYPNML
jgi:hypothetical protein